MSGMAWFVLGFTVTLAITCVADAVAQASAVLK